MVQSLIVKIIRNRNKKVQHRPIPFPLQNEHRRLTFRRQYNLTRPAPPFVRSEQYHLLIVDDWVPNIVLENSVLNFQTVPFVQELGRVNPHESDRGLIGKLVLEVLNLGKGLETADAAVCPEVEDDQFPSQLLIHAQGLTVEPRVPCWKVGRSHGCLVCLAEVLLLTDKLSDEVQVLLGEDVLAVPVLSQHLNECLRFLLELGAVHI